jgi:hypothetical protein
MSQHVQAGVESVLATGAEHAVDAVEPQEALSAEDGSAADESYEQVLEVGWTQPLEIPVTGAPAVDEAMSVLAGLSATDLHEHPQILQEVHDRLRTVLSDGASL